MAASSAIISVLTEIQDCQCSINDYYIREAILICTEELNDVIFRARLFSTPEARSTQILMFLQEWVSTGPTININGENFAVLPSCTVAIRSFNETVCPPSVTKEPGGFNYLLVYIIVGVLGGTVVVVLLFIFTLCCCCICCRRRTKYKVR